MLGPRRLLLGLSRLPAGMRTGASSAFTFFPSCYCVLRWGGRVKLGEKFQDPKVQPLLAPFSKVSSFMWKLLIVSKGSKCESQSGDSREPAKGYGRLDTPETFLSGPT